MRQREQRVLELYEANELEIQKIGEKVHLARGAVMQIVKEAYKRIGKELPEGRTRRMRLHANPATDSDPAP